MEWLNSRKPTRPAYGVKYTEWQQIEQYFPPSKLGRPRTWDMWLIVNAIFYVTRTGCQWRMMPTNLPPWQMVYGYFGRWKRNGVYEQLNATLVKQARQQANHNPQPSAASIDSQSVKTSEGGEARGVDVHKQTNGRKRHFVVDTLGFLLMVVVHSAGLQDAEGGKLTLQALFDRNKRSLYNRWCRLKLIWADGAYKGIVGYARQHFGWALEIVKRDQAPRALKYCRAAGWLSAASVGLGVIAVWRATMNILSHPVKPWFT